MSDDEAIDFGVDDDDVELIENEPPTEQVLSGNESEQSNEGENETSKKTVKPKRVRNPQLKLNAETLKGKRGVAALESYFERVKYKGRGYEEQDLGIILKTYEYWCHRLFPKLPFDQCITKIESLGSKRPIMTHLKKIRMNMLMDIVPGGNEFIADDENPSDNEIDNFSPQSPAGIQPLPTTQPHLELSEEQLEKIRLNREQAEKIRKEKLLQKKIVTQMAENTNSCDTIPDEMDTSDFLVDSQVSQTDNINAESVSQLKDLSSQISEDLFNTKTCNEALLEPEVNKIEISNTVDSSVSKNAETTTKETSNYDNSVGHYFNHGENENIESGNENIELSSDNSRDKFPILEKMVTGEERESREQNSSAFESSINDDKNTAREENTSNIENSPPSL